MTATPTHLPALHIIPEYMFFFTFCNDNNMNLFSLSTGKQERSSRPTERLVPFLYATVLNVDFFLFFHSTREPRGVMRYFIKDLISKGKYRF